MGLMTGKTVLITGANSGIGLAAALELAKMGGRILMACRPGEKSEAARRDVAAAAGNDQAAELLPVDLTSQASIRALAEEVRRRTPRLDVLLNNAGLIIPERRLTVDGIEHTFALNHLAYFLLTNLLLDLLKASAPARVVSVSSEAQRMGRIDFDDLQFEKNYSPMRVYGSSKLANAVFTFELARRLEGSGVTANCLHPGVVRTGFGRDYTGVMRVVMDLGAPFLISPEKGARTSVYLASSPEVEGVSGKYFKRRRPASAVKAACDPETGRRLWEISAKMTGLE